MKAEERHHLKTNELAEALSDLPALWQKYGQQVLTGVVIVLLVLAIGWWYIAYRRGQAAMRQTELQTELVRLSAMQLEAAEAAQKRLTATTPEEAALISFTFDADSVKEKLGEAVRADAGSPAGMVAQLAQAQAHRLELLYAEAIPAPQEREELYSKAQQTYQNVLAAYPQDVNAQGLAKMGLALLAEDQEQWEQAQTYYNEIIAAKETVFAGTVYPGQAAARLRAIKDIQTHIEFPSAPVVTEAAAPAVEALPALDPASAAAAPVQPAN